VLGMANMKKPDSRLAFAGIACVMAGAGRIVFARDYPLGLVLIGVGLVIFFRNSK
jgi:hypothetical protein